MRTYNDSKEFPLYNFERIQSTNDYFYMIKGYESGDEVEVSLEEMEIKYNEVVHDYVLSLNSKNGEIIKRGRLQQLRMEVLKYAILSDIINLQFRSILIGGEPRLEEIKALLKNFKIQKSDDLSLQLEIIDRKISKIKNEIEEIENEFKDGTGEQEQSDINQIITNVEMILERGINLKEVSLYRFGIMQEQARKKIEQLSKANSKK